MAIFDLFSKRRRNAERAGKPVLYVYDQFPTPFRVQVVHIWSTALGPWIETGPYSSGTFVSNGWWEEIHKIMARELGVPKIGTGANPFDRCATFLANADIDGVLDIIELSFRVIDLVVRKASLHHLQESYVTQAPDDAIAELNHRFREHAIGYQYTGGEVVRVDSEFLHVETVEQAVTLLHDAAFAGPNAEFLSAHDHYRHGRLKEAIADALKALESTLKAICEIHRWAYPAGATAKPLLDIVFEKGLLPAFMEGHFGGLRSTLESGLPTLRNRAAGHGQGAEPVEIPNYLGAYALHLAAVNIVLLVEAHKLSK